MRALSGRRWSASIATALTLVLTQAMGVAGSPLPAPVNARPGHGTHAPVSTRRAEVVGQQVLASDPGIRFGTLLGGSSDDYGGSVAVDAAGSIYIIGTTQSVLPTTPGAYDGTKGGYSDAFVAKFGPGGDTLEYLTYIGGGDSEYGRDIAVDETGSAFITGDTFSSDFPTSPGAFDSTHDGQTDAFVAKLSPAGDALEYSSYLGGTNNESGLGIAIDSGGNAYVTGLTDSSTFPTTPGAFDTTADIFGNGFAGFATKVDPAGASLAYSTFLGTNTQGVTPAVGSGGELIVAGMTQSVAFPTTPGAFDTTFNGGFQDQDGFVTRLNADGSALVYSTFLGGSRRDPIENMVIDASGNVFVTGLTESANFPTTAGAYDTTIGGGPDIFDGFVTAVDATGSSLLFSSFVGGSDSDSGRGIAVDGDGRVSITGFTASSDLPTTPGAPSETLSGGGNDAFVARFDPTGSTLDFGSYLGGDAFDGGMGIATDAAGAVYVVGSTASSVFPTTTGAFDESANGGYDNFLVKIGDVPPEPFVRNTSGALTLDDQPFRPIGFNIYNANSNGWCWYAMDGTILDDAMTAIGPSKNAMRAWFFQQLATTNGVRDWTAFDRTLATARAHGVKVVVTLTDQWGDCGDSTVAGYGYKDTTWYESAYRDPDPSGLVSYRDWVAEVVSRYRDDSTILTWQLVNEPEVMPFAGADCSTVPESTAFQLLFDFATDVAGLIKSIDPNHLVSLGTIGSGQCGAQADDFATLMGIPTLDLCEFHDYNPSDLVPGDQWNGLQRRIDQCDALAKPLLVGELGIRPMDVGGTFADRARVVAGKLCAQLTAGVDGLLLWAWSKDGSTLDNYDIGPGDPVLGVLDPWADPSHTCSAPSAPSNVAATAGNAQATVTWTAPPDNGSPLTGFVVTASPGGQTASAGPAATSALVTGLANGTTYTFTVTASNAAGTSPPSAPSNAVTPIVKANQTITFLALPNRTMVQSPVTASATASSGLPVSFSSLTPAVCTSNGANGQTITLIGAGTCSVRADQAGSASYNPAPPVTRNFTVSRANQSITFATLPNRTLLESPITVSATASSGLSVTFTATTPAICASSGANGSTVTLLAPGTCTITADQAGDAVYNPAPSRVRSFLVRKANQTITFAALADRTLIESPLTVSATASSGLTVTFTTTTPTICTSSGPEGSTIMLLAPGTCTVTASQPGDATYNAAPNLSRNFAVRKASQTITFAPLANRPRAQSPFTVTASASSGLTVRFTSTTPSICTATGPDGATITLLTVGQCGIRADQAGNATYAAAPGVTRRFRVQ